MREADTHAHGANTHSALGVACGFRSMVYGLGSSRCILRSTVYGLGPRAQCP